MGGLIKFLPFTYSAMLVGSLSLLATPMLTGFYSKDLIIELAYGCYSFSGTFAFILGTVAAGCTAFYSTRLLCLVFFTVPNGPKVSYVRSHESDLPITIPLFILSLFSIGFGYVASDLFVGPGSDFFGNAIFIHPNNITLIEAEFSINPVVKNLPFIFTIIGSASAFFIYNFVPTIFVELTESSIGRSVYSFLNGKYYFDTLYNNYFNKTGLQSGYAISKILDRGIIELIGPFGLSTTLNNTAQNIAKLDTGIVTIYGLYIVVALLSLTFVVFGSVLFELEIGSSSMLLVYLFTLAIVLSPNSSSA